MFTNRRPYYGLKMSATDFLREPVRYIKESNVQESMMEKPYYQNEYTKMHLSLPDAAYKFKNAPPFRHMSYRKPWNSPKPWHWHWNPFRPWHWPGYPSGPWPEPWNPSGPWHWPGYPSWSWPEPGSSNLDTPGGFAMMSFGDVKCGWRINRDRGCIKWPVIITMTAEYFFTEEFKFIANIVTDTIGVSLKQLGDTVATSQDEQDYLLTFPDNANGEVTICGFASTRTLISQTFETVVAGMPVGINLIHGTLAPFERGQGKSATLLKSAYGDKGDDCGCITISSNCTPACECKTIGYTTQQMAIDEVQTLTVNNPDPGCTYSWSIAGGGSLSSPTGTSVDYTAPSSNANCVNNATITMGVESGACDTLEIAVNAWIPWDGAYKLTCPTDYGRCIWFGGQKRCVNEWLGYRCNGVAAPECSSFDPAVCTPNTPCEDNSECVGCSVGIIDDRSPSMKEGGCCPAELL